MESITWTGVLRHIIQRPMLTMRLVALVIVSGIVGSLIPHPWQSLIAIPAGAFAGVWIFSSVHRAAIRQHTADAVTDDEQGRSPGVSGGLGRRTSTVPSILRGRGAMTDRDWYDDSDHASAVEQAEKIGRVGWTAILAAMGLMGVAAIAAIVVCLAAVVGMFYVVMVITR